MLHAGLDLSRRRLDVCILSDDGELVARTAAPPDADGLAHLVAKVAVHEQPIAGVIESMTGARFVRDVLADHGWQVQIADAHKVKDSHRSPARPTRSTPRYWRACRSSTSCRRSGCRIPRRARHASWRASGCT